MSCVQKNKRLLEFKLRNTKRASSNQNRRKTKNETMVNVRKKTNLRTHASR